MLNKAELYHLTRLITKVKVRYVLPIAEMYCHLRTFYVACI